MEKFIKAIRVRHRRPNSNSVDAKVSIYKTGLFGGSRLVKVESGILNDIGDSLPKEYESDMIDSFELSASNYGVSVDDYILVYFLINNLQDFEDDPKRAYRILQYNFIPVLDGDYESVTTIDNVYASKCQDFLSSLVEDGIVPVSSIRDEMDLIKSIKNDTGDEEILAKSPNLLKPYLEVVQEIWTEDYKPTVRKFGTDSYFLKNGSYINIHWMVDGNPIGGESYSDNWGREVTPKNEPGKSRRAAVKTFEIVPARPSDQKLAQGITFNKSGEFDYLSNMKDVNAERFEYKLDINSGTDEVKFRDSYIIDEILKKWKKFYPGGDIRTDSAIGFSTKVGEVSEELQFVDPVEKKVESPQQVTGVSETYTALPMTVFIEKKQYFARESIPSMFVQVGDMSLFVDDLSGFDELADEYTEDYFESDFRTEEEYVAYFSELAKGQDLIQGVTPNENNDYNGGNAVGIDTEATGKIKKMIEYAYGEIGYTEGKTTIKGTPGKDTKFGKAFGMNGHHWCGLFVAWCAKQAGIKLDSKGIGFGIPYVIACSTGKTQFSAKGCYTSSSSGPSPGDVAFMNWDGGTSAQHVEIVIKDLGNGKIKCIGGNTSGSKANGYNARVAENDRLKKFIIGYGKLSKYDPTNASSIV